MLLRGRYKANLHIHQYQVYNQLPWNRVNNDTSNLPNGPYRLLALYTVNSHNRSRLHHIFPQTIRQSNHIPTNWFCSSSLRLYKGYSRTRLSLSRNGLLCSLTPDKNIRNRSRCPCKLRERSQSFGTDLKRTRRCCACIGGRCSQGNTNKKTRSKGPLNRWLNRSSLPCWNTGLRSTRRCLFRSTGVCYKNVLNWPEGIEITLFALKWPKFILFHPKITWNNRELPK